MIAWWPSSAWVMTLGRKGYRMTAIPGPVSTERVVYWGLLASSPFGPYSSSHRACRLNAVPRLYIPRYSLGTGPSSCGPSAWRPQSYCRHGSSLLGNSKGPQLREQGEAVSSLLKSSSPWIGLFAFTPSTLCKRWEGGCSRWHTP